jgi:manganese/iron transport system ATP-binding protein
VIGGKDLHDDMDSRQVSILTDDERPLVTYDGKHQTARGKEEADG